MIKNNCKNSLLVSIIVPVYNTEKYLSTCIDSIINQTYKNLEIIIVDDGSTDSSPKICDEYACRDSRIKVIHKKNGGLSSARNAGLDVITGNYISFIDSDDYIAQTFIENLLNALHNDNSDFAMCNFIQINENNEVLFEFPQINSDEIGCHTISDFWRTFEKHATVSIVSWNKLYRRRLFDDIRYLEGHIHEDLYIMPDITEGSSTVSFVIEPMYYYVKHSDSIIGKLKNTANFDIDKAMSLIKLCEYFLKKEYFSVLIIQIINTVIETTINYKKSNKHFHSEKETFNKCKKTLINLYKEIRINKQSFPISYKIKFFMSIYSLSTNIFYVTYKTIKFAQFFYEIFS